MREIQKPLAYSYEDYRDFLKARFLYTKSLKKKLSVALLSRRTGVSISYFKNVFSKKRHISLGKIPTISQDLLISNLEKTYLLFKVIEQTARERKLREMCGAILGSLRWEMAIQTFEDSTVVKEGMRPLSSRLLLYTLVLLKKWPQYKNDLVWVRSLLKSTNFSVVEIEESLQQAQRFMDGIAKSGGDIDKVRIVGAAKEGGTTSSLAEQLLQEILAVPNCAEVFAPANRQCQFLNLDAAGVEALTEIVQRTRSEVLKLSQAPKKGEVKRVTLWAQCIYTVASSPEDRADRQGLGKDPW